MLRIPSLAEIFGLFTHSRTVAAATKALSDTARRLEEVAVHHERNADAKALEAQELRAEAHALAGEVAKHNAEAAKAATVAANLSALFS